MDRDERLDAAIDRTVRDLMDREPSAWMKARVLARLERPGNSWFRWFSPRRVALAGTVAATILVGYAFLPEREPEAPPRTASAHDQMLPSVRQAIAPPAPIQARTRTGATIRRERLDPEGGIVIAASIDPFEEGLHTIPPLEPLEPITIEPIASQQARVGAVNIAPIPAFEPIRIEPLSPLGGRD